MNILNEWIVRAPWGNLALVSWGDPKGQPVLLVHGRQDSVATFIPLLNLMPDKYYYVGVDMPGNGKSDPYPFGIMLSRLHFINVINIVIKFLGWNTYYYIGHSMGCEQGLFYNSLNPGRILKFVHLDAIPSLQRLQVHDYSEYCAKFYNEYYINYIQYASNDKQYTKQQAINAVMRARKLTEEQAEIVLSRNLNKVGDDKYTLSWDKRLKFPAPQNYPVDYYASVFCRVAPPILLITASENNGYLKGKEAAEHLVKLMKKNIKDFTEIKVEGTHDVHITHPERFVKDICEFFDKDFHTVKSKI